MKNVLRLLALLVVLTLASAPAAIAAKPQPPVKLVSPAAAPHTANHRLGVPELHPGSTGPDVAALQWMLSGHKPYAFSKVKPPLKAYEKGVSGPQSSRTWKGVVEFKFRIGYPGHGQCTSKKIQPHGTYWDSPTAGPYFFALLLGHKQRPACWVALANKRAAAVEAGATQIALDLKAFELKQVGVAEPHAYQIYNAYFHLPIEAWCAIFQGYSEVHVGLALLAPSNPWYVPNIITWGRYHGYLRVPAKVGEFVLYYGDISHIGYVIAVNTKSGSYTTVEGNWNNRVGVVQHPRWDHLHYFLAVPGLVK